MALESVARGERPLFVFDSYSSLVANFNEKQDEIGSQFAQPLQNLQKAMGGTGATTVVLHHTPKSGVGSIASSGSGAGRLGRIPDVVIAMESVGRYSNRLFITSSKRVAHTSLIIEQDFEAGQWICHGDAVQARELKELISKVAALRDQRRRFTTGPCRDGRTQGCPFPLKTRNTSSRSRCRPHGLESETGGRWPDLSMRHPTDRRQGLAAVFAV